MIKRQGTNLHHDEHLQQVGGAEQGRKIPQQAVQAKRSFRHAGLDPSHVTGVARGPNNRAKEYRNKEDITSLMINGRQPITDQGWDEGGENSMLSRETPTTTVEQAGRPISCSSTQPAYTSCIIWNNKVQVRIVIVVIVTAYQYLRIIASPMSSNRGQSPKSSIGKQAGDGQVEKPTQISIQQEASDGHASLTDRIFNQREESDGSLQEYYQKRCFLIMKTVILSCLLSSSYATYLPECTIFPTTECWEVEKPHVEYTTLSEVQCHPVAKEMCEQVHYTVKSREVTSQECNQEPTDELEGRCHTKYDVKCTSVHKMECPYLPEVVLHQVPHKACWDKPEKTRHEIPRKICGDVPREECNTMTR